MSGKNVGLDSGAEAQVIGSKCSDQTDLKQFYKTVFMTEEICNFLSICSQAIDFPSSTVIAFALVKSYNDELIPSDFYRKWTYR